MERFTRPWLAGRSHCWLLPFLTLMLWLAAAASWGATAPTITAISNQQTNEDNVAGPYAFQIGDAESAPNTLHLRAQSGNTNLVAPGGISFNRSGSNITVRLDPEPNANGTTTITIFVDDDALTNSTSFNITFNAVNDPPTITFLGANTIIINEDNSTASLDFVVTDVDNPLANLVVTGSASLPTVVPASAFAFSGAGSNRTVVITPAANENTAPAGTTITLQVSDGEFQVTDTFTLRVNPVQDPPSISGILGGPSRAISDRFPTNIFSGITISDVDHLKQASETVYVFALLGTNAASLGAFENVDSVALSGTPASVTTQLRAQNFAPLANSVPIGQTGSFSLTIYASNANNAAVSSTYDVFVFSENDPPTITSSLTPSQIQDSQNVLPFFATVNDPDLGDEANLTLTIEPINDPTFTYGTLEPASPSFTGSKATIESAIRGVRYRAIANASATNVVVRLRVRVTDPHGVSAASTNSLTIVAANDAPSIIGIPTTTFRITDDTNQPPLMPFVGVSIVDVDQGGAQSVRLTLSIDDGAKGYYEPPFIFAGTPTSLTYSGTPATVTAQLRGTGFRPKIRPNRVMGETVTATLGLTVIDSVGASRSDNNTRVAITSVNGAPVFNGVPTNQPLLIAPAAQVNPFTGISVADDDTNNLTLTVSLDNSAKGVLTNLSGFSQVSAGVYRIITNQVAASTALANLKFAVSTTYLFPPNEPGGTTFTLQAADSVLNTATKTLKILLQSAPRNHFVTHTDDDLTPGSLRSALTNSGNNDTITFALPEYPATLRLDKNRGPLKLTRNVTLKGPGADLLTISGDTDGNLVPDTQLFRVLATVTIEGITLSRGSGTKGETEGTGGAIYVGVNGKLKMRSCAVTDSTAAQWGGAIDVDGGALAMESCLVRSNANNVSLGLGGGAISLYTDEACSFVNTTFSGNRQRSTSGFGGGAIYAENFTPATELAVSVVHCTFAGNQDASVQGSSLHANVFGTVITVRNSIFNDNSGLALEVAGSGEIVSEGGNLCDDSTRTTLMQGGQPQSIVLLNQPSDAPSTNALLTPFSALIKPTAGYALQPGSPAIGRAVNALATDQRSVLRDSQPDSGAIEFSARRRVVINELHFGPAPGQPRFVEVYIPRDSEPVNLDGYNLLVDGVPRHIFSSGIVQPGFGVVVADGPMSANGTRVEVTSPLAMTNRGAIEIQANGQPIVSLTYNGVWSDPLTPAQNVTYSNTSLTLAPQFLGFALVPNSLVLPLGGVDRNRNTTANLTSPGADTSPTPFGSPNAFPVAVPDSLVVSEDNLTTVLALANDIDADGLDQLVIVDVSRGTNAGSIGKVRTNTVAGAFVSITPSNSPLRGVELLYDPRSVSNIQRLAIGAELTDWFYYQVLDIGTGSINSYAQTNALTQIVSPAHRLSNGTVIVISGAANLAYNGEFVVTNATADSFSIPIAFVADDAPRGSWSTKLPRVPSAPSEAKVTLKIIGANDPPTAVKDIVATDEETVIRVMGDPNLAGSTVVFPTDGLYPHKPQISSVSLLPNDSDIDTDDNSGTLKVIGVVGGVNAINGYSGTPGVSPVIVQSANHGLSTGARILISGYSGHPSYNAFHIVTVLNSNSFSIPVFYVDDAAQKGVWAVLTDATRLTATSLRGAAVNLEIRTDRIETSIVYNPRTSSFLNGLALGESTNDVFYYAVEDSHGGTSFGQVEVQVAGVNDAPMPVSDPGSLGALAGLVGGGQTLSQVVAQLSVEYFLPPASGESNRVDATVIYGGNPPPYAIANIWRTDEETALAIPSPDLLGNDSDVDRSDILTVSAISPLSAQGAAITLGAGGTVVTYNPSVSATLNKLAREETTIDSFFATITDSHGGSVTSLVAVLVVGVNDTPVARDDSTGTPEDVGITFNPLFFPINNSALFDIDVDVNGLSPDNRTNVISVVNLLTPGGALVNIASNQLNYNPSVSAFLDGLAVGQTFVDTFNYTITDGSLLFANNDSFKVPADGANFPLDVLANDRNLNRDATAFAITSVGTPSQGGTVVIGAGNTNLIYTPQINFVGTEVFVYNIADGQGNVDRGLVTVRVTLNQLNGNIFAGADHYSVAKGEAPLLNVLGNDNTLPLSGTALTITRIVTPPTLDAVTIEANGIRFTQTNGGPFPYTQTFSYEVSGGGTARSIAEVTVEVIDREGTLSVRNDTFSIASGTQDAALDVLANDTLVSGSSAGLRIRSIVTPPSHGMATTNGQGTLARYTPANGFVGQDTFTYLAVDGFGGTGLGIVTIAVGSLSTSSDFFVVPFDSSSETNDNGATELDVLANDGVIGAGGETIKVVSVTPTNSSLGVMSIKPDGTKLIFDPAVNVEGEVEFTYTIRDGSANVTAQGKATVSVVREGVNANPDYFAVLADSSANQLNVLYNDAAIPNLGRTLTIVTIDSGADAPNQGGTVILNDTNDRLIYTPAAGFSGEETFTYTMTDSRKSDTARVVVRVTGGALAANNDAFTVFFETNSDNTARAFTLPVLANDRALPDLGQLLTITGVGLDDINATNAPSQQGSVVIAPDGSALIYTPGDFDGPFPYVERFTYEISDGTARRTEGVVVIEVQQRLNVRDIETHDDEFAVRSASLNNVLPLLANDNIKPATPTGWTITSVSSAAFGGLVTINGQSVFYTPQSGFIGTDSFTYTVSDGFGGTGHATVRVKVGDVTVCPDTFVALSGTSNNVLPVLINDFKASPNGAAFPLSALGVPDRGGIVTLNSNATAVLYSPDPNFESNHPGARYPYEERFSYEVIDDSGRAVVGDVKVNVFKNGSDQDRALVSITVHGVNDAPTLTGAGPTAGITDKQTIAPFTGVTIRDVDDFGAQRVTVVVSIDNPVKGRLTGLGSFVETAPGTYLFRDTGSNVTAAIRQLVFVPTENRITVPTTESTTFTITLNDGFILSPVVNSATVIPVTAVNDAPVVSGTMPIRVYSRATVKPLYGSVITEVDDLRQQRLSVTVTLSDATHGYVTSLGGFASNSPTTLTMANVTAATASAALQGLVFVPTPGNRVQPGIPESTRFTIAVNDGFAATVTDTNTVVTAYESFIARIEASDRVAGNPSQFGRAVAAARDFAIAGAPADSANSGSGSAYIFARSRDGSETWTQVAKLLPFDGANNDQYGSAVAICDDIAVVGSPNDDDRGANSGAIYIYQRSAAASNVWNLLRKVAPVDATNNAMFGLTVALDDDTLVVGAGTDSTRGNSAGSAYILQRHQGGSNQWGVVKKIFASDIANNDQFGSAVAIHRDTIVVGAPLHNGGVGNSGAAYVFSRNQGGSNQWGEVKQLLATTPAFNDQFGSSVAISIDTVVVGVPLKDVPVVDGGTALIYERNLGGSNQWGFVKRVLASDSAAANKFGNGVGVDGDNIVAGAPGNDALGDDAGSSYVYNRNTAGGNQWGQVRQFFPRTGIGSLYGTAVALSHSTVVVGTPQEATSGSRFGSVYIYLLKFNNGPQLINPIQDQLAPVGAPFAFTVPANTFSDGDVPDTLTFSAARADGSSLPTWLSFNPLTGAFSGTPAAGDATVLSIRVTARDVDAEMVSTTFALTVVGGTLSDWRANYFGAAINDPTKEGSIWGNSADPDGDGLNNWAEYVSGSNPTAVNASSLRLAVLSDSVNDHVWIGYERRRNDPQIIYRLEFSTNFGAWNSAAPLVIETAVPISVDFERVTAELLDYTSAPRFFRLRVTTGP